MGLRGPCALIRKMRPFDTIGVGTGQSPPPDIRQISSPVRKSYPPICFQPLTSNCGRGPSRHTLGVLHVPVSSLGVRHTSCPSVSLNAATNPLVSTSHCMNTQPL